MKNACRIVAAALILIAAPSFPAMGAPAKGTAAKVDPDKKICKRIVRPGTIAGRTNICKTAAEWEVDRREAQIWGRDRIDGCAVRSADPAEPGQAAVTCAK